MQRSRERATDEKTGLWARLSVWTLIASNLVPLYGVLVHDWSALAIMLLFWLENVVIGVFNVVRMIVAQPPAGASTEGGQGGKLFLVPFFCVHYGIFTFVHGIFVFSLFGGDSLGAPASATSLSQSVSDALGRLSLGWALAALVLSHGVSFFTNYIGRGEYRRHSVGRLLFQPYGRVVILHLAILGGGFLALALGSPTWALATLVVLKIAVDLGAHAWEHRGAASAAA